MFDASDRHYVVEVAEDGVLGLAFAETGSSELGAGSCFQLKIPLI
jgi:hypothetical protein